MNELIQFMPLCNISGNKFVIDKKRYRCIPNNEGRKENVQLEINFTENSNLNGDDYRKFRGLARRTEKQNQIGPTVKGIDNKEREKFFEFLGENETIPAGCENCGVERREKLWKRKEGNKNFDFRKKANSSPGSDLVEEFTSEEPSTDEEHVDVPGRRKRLRLMNNLPTNYFNSRPTEIAELTELVELRERWEKIQKVRAKNNQSVIAIGRKEDCRKILDSDEAKLFWKSRGNSNSGFGRKRAFVSSDFDGKMR